MKKNYSPAILCICLLLLGNFNITHAQRNNIWYFAQRAGLDFSSGAPVEIFNSPMYSYEGTASICDTAGNLLFYTNGGPLQGTHGKIWNRLDSVMQNGDLDSCHGCNSSCQSAVIIPKPGSPSLYYIFTTDCMEHSMAGGFRFYIVDMTLDGGLGAVTIKDSLLCDSVNESICGISHANAQDYWVVVHRFASDDFYAYLISANGISSPVISKVGSHLTWNAGQLTANCFGTKLAYGQTWSSELFDFNNSTGVVSYSSSLSFQASYCAFSPSGRFLYMGQGGGSNEIRQYDMYSPNMVVNAQTIATSTNYYSQFALAPDHKIYISRYGKYLSAINSPDNFGTGCQYVDSALTLSRDAYWGLPNFVNTFATGACIATDISENTNGNKPSLFPNPFSNQLTFSLAENVQTTVSLYNFLGQQLLQQTFTNSTTINTAQLANGIYFYELRSNKEALKTGKLVKQ